MKLVMDEKLKHRLVGVSVILSLGAIFLPAMMKKSSQRLESNFSVNVKLPPKPVAPNVVMTDEDQMFKTIKVSKAGPASIPVAKELPPTTDLSKDDFVASVPVHEEKLLSVAKVEQAPLSIEKPIELAVNNAVKAAAKKEIKVAVNKPVKPIKTAALRTVKAKVASKPTLAKATAKKSMIKKDIYAVQLASFSKLVNAQALVNKLHKKGYKASYTRIATRSGVVYKVYAGHSPVKTNVLKLKTQLASAMQLNGFVVTTGVS